MNYFFDDRNTRIRKILKDIFLLINGHNEDLLVEVQFEGGHSRIYGMSISGVVPNF